MGKIPSWGTPNRYNKLFLITIKTDMIWDTTKDRLKPNIESTFALDEPVLEPETVLEEPPFEDEIVATSNQILLRQVRNIIVEIGTIILKFVCVSDNSWGIVNYAGFRPFNSLYHLSRRMD